MVVNELLEGNLNARRLHVLRIILAQFGAILLNIGLDQLLLLQLIIHHHPLQLAIHLLIEGHILPHNVAETVGVEIACVTARLDK